MANELYGEKHMVTDIRGQSQEVTRRACRMFRTPLPNDLSLQEHDHAASHDFAESFLTYVGLGCTKFWPPCSSELVRMNIVTESTGRPPLLCLTRRKSEQRHRTTVCQTFEAISSRSSSAHHDFTMTLPTTPAAAVLHVGQLHKTIGGQTAFC